MDNLIALAVSFLVCMNAFYPKANGTAEFFQEGAIRMNSQTAYLIMQRRPNIDVSSKLTSDGTLDVTVRLAHPGGSMTWQSRLSQQALLTCEDVIKKLAEQKGSNVPQPTFKVDLIKGQSQLNLASWNEVHESSHLRIVRRTLESNEHLNYFVALTHLRIAASIKNEQDTGELYKRGIAILGDDYQDKGVNDDSGMKLVLAQDVERSAGILKAAPIYQRVLETRVAIYAGREGLPL